MLPAERLFHLRILGHDQINVEELRRHDTALDKPVFVNGLSALRASKTDWLRSGNVSYRNDLHRAVCRVWEPSKRDKLTLDFDRLKEWKMNYPTYLPMMILASLLICGLAVMAYLTLRKWRNSRTPSEQVDPAQPMQEWLVREAHSAVDQRTAHRSGTDKRAE
jgi:hypothetical protein